MRQSCVCCVARSAPPSQFVMSVRSTIVLNVLTPTLVGPMLFGTSPVTQPLRQHPPQHNIGDMHVQHIRVPRMSLWPWRLLTGQDRYEGTARTNEQHIVQRELGTHYAGSHPVCLCVWSPSYGTSCLPYALSQRLFKVLRGAGTR